MIVPPLPNSRYWSSNSTADATSGAGDSSFWNRISPSFTPSAPVNAPVFEKKILPSRADAEAATSPPMHSCDQSRLPVSRSKSSANRLPAVKTMPLPSATTPFGDDHDGALSRSVCQTVSPVNTFRAKTVCFSSRSYCTMSLSPISSGEEAYPYMMTGSGICLFQSIVPSCSRQSTCPVAKTA